jgi:1-aminocyclopropane-1-carboxylate deaminase/D-cysteine desulfhydrase-like pyridoxal-dependent ACC family enzyme
MTQKHTINQLRKKINTNPRVKLADLPTPLHQLKGLSDFFGGPKIFIKRDDLTGLAFGGNKTRMFEFLLARAVHEGADCVVGGAAVQSNYCRQLTAACNILGIETYLVLRRIRGIKDNNIQGNLLLDLIAGAHVHIIDGDQNEQRKAIYELADKLKKGGKNPFVVRMANDRDLTPDVAAYIECFCEIIEQSSDLHIIPSRIYVSSYDSTQAGLEIGKRALGSNVRIIGITPAIWDTESSECICRYANQAARNLDLDVRITAKELCSLSEYVGKSYGIPTADGIEMIKLMARKEGIFLDPVYTSKAFAALRDHIEQGEIGKDENVVFLHTGGNPALHAYVEELDYAELQKYLSFS